MALFLMSRGSYAQMASPEAVLVPQAVTATPFPVVTIPFGNTAMASDGAVLSAKTVHNHKSVSKIALPGLSEIVLEEQDAHDAHDISYTTIASDALVDRASPMAQYENTAFWISRGAQALYGYNVDTGGIFSTSIEASESASLVFMSANNEKVKVTYDGSAFTFQNISELLKELE